jgi:hypothetical protein
VGTHVRLLLPRFESAAETAPSAKRDAA